MMCSLTILMDFCTAYLDDIMIYSDNELKHEEHVRKVLLRLHEAGLQADIKKSEFSVKHCNRCLTSLLTNLIYQPLTNHLTSLLTNHLTSLLTNLAYQPPHQTPLPASSISDF